MCADRHVWQSDGAVVHDAPKPTDEHSSTPVEPLMTTAYKRLIVREPQSGVTNFKKFKKVGWIGLRNPPPETHACA